MKNQDDPIQGYCCSCGAFVTAKAVDYGIGAYECHGARGIHHDWQQVCPLCEGEIDEAADIPCQHCKNYDPDEYPPDGCRIDLAARGISGPEELYRGQNCRFFESTED